MEAADLWEIEMVINGSYAANCITRTKTETAGLYLVVEGMRRLQGASKFLSSK